jgi:glycosyltransferase involved in cell wall biosynthesis
MNRFIHTAVIIPAYNEVKHIKKVVRKVKKHTNNIIVIDDGSTDGTANELESENIIVLKHLVNLGKGAALTTGIEYAKKLGFKKIILMDSDSQHNADEIVKFVNNLEKHDLVLGFRKLNFKMTDLRFIGNRVDTLLIELLFGKKITDPICGFRAFNMKIYPQIKWESTGYGVETEIVIRAILNNIKLMEIPVSSIYLDKYKGVSIIDAYKIFFDVLKWRISL